jgi:hypothetical protein
MKLEIRNKDIIIFGISVVAGLIIGYLMKVVA